MSISTLTQYFYKILPFIKNDFFLLLFYSFCGYVIYLITKKVLLSIVKKIIVKSKTKIDDYFFEQGALSPLIHMPPAVFVFVFSDTLIKLSEVMKKASLLVLLFSALLFVNKLLVIINKLYQQKSISKTKPMTGYLQALQIALAVFAIVGSVSILLGKSPLVLLSGIGAFTAIILLIFRETILSFVAGFQIQMNDIIRVGDWIELPQHGVDGDVLEIALHTIKVQNWDKTISTVPTSLLINQAVKNWRGMAESGGRRIKRSILIDQDSIAFLSPVKINQLKKMQLLKPYLLDKERKIKTHNQKLKKSQSPTPGNERKLTNIGTFRAYIKAYLLFRGDINHNLTFLIRQLAPSSEKGLPIEVYVFTKTTNWIEYEEVQSEIMDHLLSILPQFGLRAYQRLSNGKNRL